MPHNKCHKLGLQKVYVCDVEAEFGRFLVIPHNLSRNFGGCIKRSMEKFPVSNLISQVHRPVKETVRLLGQMLSL